MKNGLKIVLNIAIMTVVVSFVWYMILGINKDDSPGYVGEHALHVPIDSPYTQISTFDVADGDINSFELHGDRLYVASKQQIHIYGVDGQHISSFTTGGDVRDMAANGDELYLLFPTRIEVYDLTFKFLRKWDACSELSDYCALAVGSDGIFVTDAANKNICKYAMDGTLAKFIESPRDFIIPSYNFDIQCWNDTVYCVNAGRHLVERYTLDGTFISAFGGPGIESGFFAGCCNPAHITFSADGTLVTSEKGNPRVCYFSRNGNFGGVLLNARMLGGGNDAREVKVAGNRLFIAGKNKIMVFETKI